ncbi:MAG: division/cell wall cluster transcriptional repressor MraZ [Desulfobulbus sp.]|nr:division/cell wall cluster transcriptional repressor MraZ [Desulfobulbus sp.]
MSRFRSLSKHTLDSKGRLIIPVPLRKVLRDRYDSEDLIVTHWVECLRVYPVVEWEAVEERLLTGENTTPEFAQFARYAIAGVCECSVDKQGRILVPPTLRSEMEIGKEVAVVGMLRHFEIWDQQAWHAEAADAKQNYPVVKPDLQRLRIF